MRLLSIETSCDDTCISILEVHPARNRRGKKGGATNASFKVLANNSNSQIKIHIPYGGVYPVLAKREHAKNLPIILEACLKQAKLYPYPTSPLLRGKRKEGVNLIAVTYGPGLEMCLWEGITFAKNLAEKWKVPLIPVNHMEGHVLSVFGKHKGKFSIKKIKNPAISLLASGGHTQLVLIKNWGKYEIIGKTLDDAVGEAFDKVARMLELPYPGGPQISNLAEKLRKSEKQNQTFSLPRPMLYSKNFDFSFSGLKTAVLYLTRKIGKLDNKTKSAIALEFENAAIECLVHKTKKAMEKYGAKTLIVAGGVAANKHLRNEMKKVTGKKIKLLFPTQELSGDNSLMIGIAGYLNYMRNKKKVPKMSTIKATGNLSL